MFVQETVENKIDSFPYMEAFCFKYYGWPTFLNFFL